MTIRHLCLCLIPCLVATTGRAQASAPFIPLDQLDAPQHYGQEVTTSGTVVETFRDEVDPDWHFLVLKDGDIVESGTHTQLLAQNGFYAEQK